MTAKNIFSTSHLFRLVLGIGMCLTSTGLSAQNSQPDPNFHVYLCFGQSNMEGNAAVTDANKEGISPRFRVLSVCNSDQAHNNRAPGRWYTAIPPLCRWNTGLTPADYFGRTLCDSLPDSIRIGIVMVALGGASIDAFDKEKYLDEYATCADWFRSYMDCYNKNPYGKLVDMAKKAMKSGVIKGILFHQGETNNGQQTWLPRVKKVYTDLLNDLGLEAQSVPFLAGEMLREEEGGCCWGHNTLIHQLPTFIPNSFIVSSEGCHGNGTDALHFSNEGYQELGRHYAQTMMSVLRNYGELTDKTSIQNQIEQISCDAENLTVLVGGYTEFPLRAKLSNGTSLNISHNANYHVDEADKLSIESGYIHPKSETETTVTAEYTKTDGATLQAVAHVKALMFPLVKGLLNPGIYGTGTYNATLQSVKTSQYGFAGWVYPTPVDLTDSQDGYIVIKLKRGQSCNATLKLYDSYDYWAKAYEYKLGSGKSFIIPLKDLNKSDGQPLDISNICMAGLWSDGTQAIYIQDIYLSSDGKTPTVGICSPKQNNQPSIAKRCYYNTNGQPINAPLTKGLTIIRETLSDGQQRILKELK